MTRAGAAAGHQVDDATATCSFRTALVHLGEKWRSPDDSARSQAWCRQGPRFDPYHERGRIPCAAMLRIHLTSSASSFHGSVVSHLVQRGTLRRAAQRSRCAVRLDLAGEHAKRGNRGVSSAAISKNSRPSGAHGGSTDIAVR